MRREQRSARLSENVRSPEELCLSSKVLVKY
jgi:hypothetical protein